VTIPEIRRRLHELADELAAGMRGGREMSAELRRLAEATRRRPAPRVAPIKSHPATAQTSEEIRKLAKFLPNASQAEIAHEFNVNPGRVSEALRGKRQ